MSASDNLHNRSATRVAIAFDDLAFDLSPNQQFQSREFFTEAGQSHEQFWRFWPTGAERLLRRRIGFENEDSARPQATHHFSVNLEPNRGR